MTKVELVASAAKISGVSAKDAEKVIAATLDTIKGVLKKGDKIILVGFGSFSVSKRSARTGRNPQTGAVLKIAARKVPKFSAGKTLKDAVNGVKAALKAAPASKKKAKKK